MSHQYYATFEVPGCCPYCRSVDIEMHYWTASIRRLRCKACEKTFAAEFIMPADPYRQILAACTKAIEEVSKQ